VLRGRFDKRIGWVAGGVAVLVAGLLTWALWPSSEEPRPRAYRDATACLLTDQKGVAGADAAPVWAGLLSASERTHGQARYLAVTGDQTAANAESFVGTLVLGKCAVIVAGSGIAGDAVRAVAGQQPRQQFLLVGGAAPTSDNVTQVAADRVADVVAGILDD
jgi:hypothetical protein